MNRSELVGLGWQEAVNSQLFTEAPTIYGILAWFDFSYNSVQVGLVNVRISLHLGDARIYTPPLLIFGKSTLSLYEIVIERNKIETRFLFQYKCTTNVAWLQEPSLTKGFPIIKLNLIHALRFIQTML